MSRSRRSGWGWPSALVVLAAVGATWPGVARAASGNAMYYGGHVISHVDVVPVAWGSGVSSDVTGRAEAFFSTLVNSPYIDWLGEYDTAGKSGVDKMPGSNQHVNRGTARALVSITPRTATTKLTDAAIQAELVGQITSGKLPAPKVDAEGGVDTVYVLAFPPSVSVTDFGGQDVCSGGCAYHWTVSVPGVSSGVPYAVIPDCSAGASQCSLGSGVFDTYTGDAAHELVEAITDPECGLATSAAATRPLAWFDPAQAGGEGELGDICLSDPSAFVSYQGYMVQAIWSHRLGRCITNDASLTLCDGKTRPCRPCAASDCSGAKPVCQTDMTSPSWGQCVAPGAGGDDGQGGTDTGGSSGSSGSSGTTGSSGAGSGGSAASPSGHGSSSSGCAMTEGRAPDAVAGLAALVGLLVLGRGLRRRSR